MKDIIIPTRGDKIYCTSKLTVQQLKIAGNKKQQRTFMLYAGQVLEVVSSLYVYDNERGVYACRVALPDREETFGELSSKLDNIVIPSRYLGQYFKLLEPGEHLPIDYQVIIQQKKEMEANARWEDLD